MALYTATQHTCVQEGTESKIFHDSKSTTDKPLTNTRHDMPHKGQVQLSAPEALPGVDKGVLGFVVLETNARLLLRACAALVAKK